MSDISSPKIFTVSEINNIIKDFLEKEYGSIWIEGELSNTKIYSSGHLYFTLKDKDAQIKGVMFGFHNKKLRFKPDDGLRVLIKGKLTCYVVGGQYQIICEYMEPKGVGALQLAFEQLKKKLKDEGLFDAERKQAIPMLPQRVGIVTSPTGAAIRDILSIINRRYANLEIIIYPVRVQGETARYEISEAIKYLNEFHSNLDVLLVGRGGGSIEDLWAFNEELVARAIADSRIPVISCVGHEVDFVISDFVADLRASTPSAAAEMLVSTKEELEEKIAHYFKRITKDMLYIWQQAESELNKVKSSRILSDPYSLITELTQTRDYLSEKLHDRINLIMKDCEHKLLILKEKLYAMSPKEILKKGYSIVEKIKTKRVVVNSVDLEKDDEILIQFYKGAVIGKVK
ncbi:MAG: exodeoxyribonuclease VII large subunit [Elusimicrobiota bacterium]